MLAGSVSAERRDGDRVDSPGNTYLICDACGTRLPWLIFLGGKLVCRLCFQDSLRKGRR